MVVTMRDKTVITGDKRLITSDSPTITSDKRLVISDNGTITSVSDTIPVGNRDFLIPNLPKSRRKEVAKGGIDTS
jgi:hypothetical protein